MQSTILPLNRNHSRPLNFRFRHCIYSVISKLTIITNSLTVPKDSNQHNLCTASILKNRHFKRLMPRHKLKLTRTSLKQTKSKTMFSSLIKLLSSLFGLTDHWDSWEVDVNLEEFLREIKCESSEKIYSFEQEEEEENSLGKKRLGQGRDEEFEVEIFECCQRTGKVTYLSEEYGLIDELVYFDKGKVSAALTLREGSEVIYSVYKARENESEKVYKIYALKNDFWDCNEESDGEDAFGRKKCEKEIVGLSRLIMGKVVERRGRKFLIEPLNIWCNLEKVNATYIPMEGDWVSLEAIVAINKDAVDLSGELLEITSVKPLLSKSGHGRITLWSDAEQEGAIENKIFFSKTFCNIEYMPGLGDEVAYDAIESDQGLFKWRAMKVMPTKTSINTGEHFSREEIMNLLADKSGISIRPHTFHLELELNRSKEATIEISNSGTIDRILMEAHLQCAPERSQARLKNAVEKPGLKISPNETVGIVFECRGKFLGSSEEICVFEFEKFRIGIVLLINVGESDEMKKFLSCKSDFVQRIRPRKNLIRRNGSKEEMTVTGPKPWQGLKFMGKEKMGYYKVPEKLWNAVMGESECEKNRAEVVRDVEEYAPCLKVDLNDSQYAERFHILLYLEEIEMRKKFMQYKRSGVFPFRKGDYMVLEVVGLSEQSPSLISGDKIILTQPWSEAKKVRQIGYIFEIRQQEIWAKFHESFHQNYDGSECDVEFEPGAGSFTRPHDAVNRAVKVLGVKWLFPTAINEKPAQIEVEIEGEKREYSNREKGEEKNLWSDDMKKFECDLDENGYVLTKKTNSPKKKLTWFNKKLNERQKMAVANVLKGSGRPLPYVIFGPPGTGKTSTMVEIVLQVYHLIPGSRLLVTSPSNSSADLICERLIEMGKFKPGQLVRLMAFTKVMQEKVSPKLMPYSTLVDIGDHSRRPNASLPNLGKIRGSSFSQLVGRHRITVGTCACTGMLHYMAFPLGHFTHILVDEAGQATEPDVLISASFQNAPDGQVVLVGDPQQLGPVCLSKIASSYGLGVSLMQRLFTFFPYKRDVESFSSTSGFDPRFVTMLNVNYRSVPEILSLSSRMFYNSELIPAVSQTNGIEADIIRRFNFKLDNRKEPPAIVFHGIFGQNYQEPDTPSWFNPHEVWQTVTYLRKLYDIGLTCDEIGIIAPYLKQVQKLKFLLNALNLSVPKIGTVENFQGQERQVIIVSTVRSCVVWKSEGVRQLLGFLACPRRLNVILTRARALLIILGNPAILSRDPYWKNVLDYCLKNNSYTGCNLMQWKLGEENCDEAVEEEK